MGAEVAVLETRMLGAKERVLLEADDGAKGWGSRSVFERCPETRVATPRTATLNTGRAIPLLGFGTWKLAGDAKTKAVVRDAIRAGYRAPAYLVHCPFTAPGPTLEPPLGDTWREMTKVYELGLARAVGVSNFSLKKVDALEGLVPAVLQVELHPLLRQTALLEGCAARGIHVTAYSPLGSADSAAFMKHDGACGRVRARFASAIRERFASAIRDRSASAIQHRAYLLGGKLLEHAEVKKVAGSAGCTPAQALLKYGVQRGCSVLPKSPTASRIAENAEFSTRRSFDVGRTRSAAVGDGVDVARAPSRTMLIRAKRWRPRTEKEREARKHLPPGPADFVSSSLRNLRDITIAHARERPHNMVAFLKSDQDLDSVAVALTRARRIREAARPSTVLDAAPRAAAPRPPRPEQEKG
ncbi:oxidoreductase [Aureococcus anophagefferens]|nr:oxidoreductase [Aureococcus anophagefferens]